MKKSNNKKEIFECLYRKKLIKMKEKFGDGYNNIKWDKNKGINFQQQYLMTKIKAFMVKL